MAANDHMVSLGFTSAPVPAGTHICQIFTDDDERNTSLLAYIVSGLTAGERVACFSEKVDSGALSAAFSGSGLTYDRLRDSGAFSLAATGEVYFEGNLFDPDRMLALLADFHQGAVDGGYSAARVIGEMTPEVQVTPGGSRLIEYESRVSLLLRERPVTAVCQYDANTFDGATIMDVLKVHPLMIVRGAVVHNPFYLPPEEILC